MRFQVALLAILMLGACATAKPEQKQPKLPPDFPGSYFNGKEYVLDCAGWAAGSKPKYLACLSWLDNKA